MGSALSSGVSGLQAHQKMLDIAGNNLANVNTVAFKGSRIIFSELLSETIKKASQPTTNVGGTNPQQMGSGVGIAGIVANMSQGNIIQTGNPLDLAMEGEGYFVLTTDGTEKIYTRAGAFAVDADNNLVDPSTGYMVNGSDDASIHIPYDVPMQPTATATVTMNGNLSSSAALATAQKQKVTSDVTYTTTSAGTTTNAVAATKIIDLDQVTGTPSGTLTVTGTLQDGTSITGAGTTLPITASTTMDDILTWLNTDNGEAAVDEVQTISTTDTPDGVGTTYTLSFGGETTAAIAFDANAAAIDAALEDLSTIGVGGVSVTGGPLASATPIVVTFDGAAMDDTDQTAITIDASGLTTGGSASATPIVTETTKGGLSGVLGKPNGRTATATIVDGAIVVTDTTGGYSKLDLDFAYTIGGSETWTMPGYFKMTTVGGEEVQNFSIATYDSAGGKHILNGAFTRTDTANKWDIILSSVTGNVSEITMANRRIFGVNFEPTGAYKNVDSSADPEFTITFAHDTSSPQTITLGLGTEGKYDGLTQFAEGESTAQAVDQDGYTYGVLSSVSIDGTGKVIGSFSNGEKSDVATIQLATFQNTSGLESVGGGYYTQSANSGEPQFTQGLTGGAGRVLGGSLEKSNADVATEFVNMIQAQNGFQANARTIKVANDILRELTQLIR